MICTDFTLAFRSHNPCIRSTGIHKHIQCFAGRSKVNTREVGEVGAVIVDAFAVRLGRRRRRNEIIAVVPFDGRAW